LFSGIGNAYSNEILFQARMSPIALTQKLGLEQIERLFEATRLTLTNWVERLRAELTQPVGLGPRARGSSLKKDVVLKAKGKEREAAQPIGLEDACA